jgi:mannose-6-phosphate isomerase-like protein (cupin superfamily)
MALSYRMGATRHTAGTRHDVGMADPTHEDRPWGNYTVLSDEVDHKVKRIVVLPGQRLHYQRHAHRSEHWFILAGAPVVNLDGPDTPMLPGQAVDVPVGTAHRVGNPGAASVVLIEVQHGTSFGEDDIERLDDDYGR